MVDFTKRPRFPTASIGYAPRAVDQMLDRLRDSASTGESAASILESTPLTKVSFGYDMEEVDEYIAAIILESAPPPPAEAPIEPEQPAEPEDTRERWPVPPAQSGGPVPASPSPDVVAVQLEAVQRVKFRRSQGRPGYDVQEVERLLDRLEDALREGQDISSMVRRSRFGMSRAGYEPQDVDRFLSRLAAGESPLPITGTATKSAGVAIALILAIGIPLLIIVFFVT